MADFHLNQQQRKARSQKRERERERDWENDHFDMMQTVKLVGTASLLLAHGYLYTGF